VTVVLVVGLTVVIVVVVAYGGAALGMRFRSRQQTMPVGWPLAAAETVVVRRSPAAARDLVIEVLGARGARPRLTTPSQVIFVPALFPSGPLGTMVWVWFRPSVGVDAAETEILVEGQEVWQQRRGIRATPESGPPGARREVDAIVAALAAADGPAGA
jgi:hypothetical protein